MDAMERDTHILAALSNFWELSTLLSKKQGLLIVDYDYSNEKSPMETNW